MCVPGSIGHRWAVTKGNPRAMASMSIPLLRIVRGLPALGGVVLLIELAALVCFAAGYDAVDIHVYSLGGAALLHDYPLYQFQWRGLGFTYPPFAAIVAVPLSWAPAPVARVMWDLGSVAALAAVWHMLLRMAGIRVDRARLMWILAGSFLLQPVWDTLFLGQVNLFLLLLVVSDLYRVRQGRHAGLGIGLAAAIKLTPLIFIGVLLLAGRVRSALIAMATFGAAALVGYLLAPQASRMYWSSYLFDTTRIGAATYISNQSPYGALARLLGGAAEVGAWYLLVPLLIAVIGIATAVTYARRDDWLAAFAVTGVAGLLISPISWSHHWVWALPAIVLVARSGRAGRRRALGVALLGTLAPQWWLPTNLQTGFHGPITLLANSFTIAGLVFLASAGWTAFRPTRPNPIEPFDSAAATEGSYSPVAVPIGAAPTVPAAAEPNR